MSAPLLPAFIAPVPQAGTPANGAAGAGFTGGAPAGLSALARAGFAMGNGAEDAQTAARPFSAWLLLQQGAEATLNTPAGNVSSSLAALPANSTLSLPEDLGEIARTLAGLAGADEPTDPLPVINDVPLTDMPATKLKPGMTQQLELTVETTAIEAETTETATPVAVTATSTPKVPANNDEAGEESEGEEVVELAAPELALGSEADGGETVDAVATPVENEGDIEARGDEPVDLPAETGVPVDFVEIPLDGEASTVTPATEQAAASPAGEPVAAPQPAATPVVEDAPELQRGEVPVGKAEGEAKPARPVQAATPAVPADQAEGAEPAEVQKPILPDAPADRRPAIANGEGQQATGPSKTQGMGEAASQFGQNRGEERGNQQGQPNPLLQDATLEIDLADRPGMERSERASRPSFSEALLNAGRSARLETDIDEMPARLRIAAANGIERLTVNLRPASLGAVDVQIDSADDGSIRASFIVQRPETLDLLQRDARMLERALSDAGLNVDPESLSFSLSDQGGGNEGLGDDDSPGGGHAGGDADASGEPIIQDIALSRQAIIEAGRIDVRI